MKPLKIYYENDWAKDVYYHKNGIFKTITKVSIKKQPFKVIGKKIQDSYGDHGHTYFVDFIRYFILCKVVGVTIEVDIRTMVKHSPVYATQYTLEEA